jgi:integrase
MSIYKRGGTYWYKFMWCGKMVCESTKQGNDKIARKIEAAHRTRLAEGLVGIREKRVSHTLANFLVQRIEPWAKARPSWLWYRSGLRPLLAWKDIAQLKLEEITSETVAGYAAHRQVDGLQIGTINRELRVLRRVMRLAVEWGVLEKAPKVQTLRGEKRRERVVGDEEFARYLLVATQLLAEVTTTLRDTGMRPDESHRLRWPDIRFLSDRQSNLLVRSGKTAAARRELPLTPRVRALLEARWENAGRPQDGWVWPSSTKSGHIDHSTLKKQHRNALTLSGVRPFVIYSLRHTFATQIAPHVDAWTLCKIMGWSSLAVAMTYIHPDHERVLDAFSTVGGYKTGYSADSELSKSEAEGKLNADESERYVVSADGLEPSTHALKGHCSAN